MAVEVRHRRKHLHHVALPIATGVAVLSIITGVGVTQALDGGVSKAVRVAQALVTPTVHVTPKSNGLAQITTQKNAEPDSSTTDYNTLGQAANFTFAFQNQ